MKSFYKYLPSGAADTAWGLQVLSVGYNKIGKREEYPAKDHPLHHYFNWTDGRVLHEFQVIYISNGTGSFESKSCALTKVKEGSILLLFPNEWHRFKPDYETGWEEYWIGCNGTVLKTLYKQQVLSRKQPVIPIGIQENLLHLFNEVIQVAKKENAGHQPHLSGATLHLLGVVHSLSQTIPSRDNKHDDLIRRAIEMIRANIEAPLSFHNMAAQFDISYSLFRKLFVRATGLAPHQYFIQLKLDRARLLLSDPQLTIKKIAEQLGFENAFYFSKVFKARWGKSPKAYRKGGV